MGGKNLKTKKKSWEKVGKKQKENQREIAQESETTIIFIYRKYI